MGPRLTRQAETDESAAMRSTDSVCGRTRSTAILRLNDPRIRRLATASADLNQLSADQRMYLAVADAVRPVYAMNELQQTTRTLDRRRGSCAQRMAVLEAAARAAGIPTRTRALLVQGTFWHARFARLSPLVPATVPVAWTEFHVDGTWVAFGDLFAGAASSPSCFANARGETLFDAAMSGGLSWDDSVCPMSRFLLADLGYYGDRDEFHAHHGTALPRSVARVADLAFSRWAST